MKKMIAALVATVTIAAMPAALSAPAGPAPAGSASNIVLAQSGTTQGGASSIRLRRYKRIPKAPAGTRMKARRIDPSSINRSTNTGPRLRAAAPKAARVDGSAGVLDSAQHHFHFRLAISARGEDPTDATDRFEERRAAVLARLVAEGPMFCIVEAKPAAFERVAGGFFGSVEHYRGHGTLTIRTEEPQAMGESLHVLPAGLVEEVAQFRRARSRIAQAGTIRRAVPRPGAPCD